MTTFFEKLQSNLSESGVILQKEKMSSQLIEAAKKEVPEPSITHLHQRGCTHTDHKDCNDSDVGKEGYQENLPESPRFLR